MTFGQIAIAHLPKEKLSEFEQRLVAVTRDVVPSSVYACLYRLEQLHNTGKPNGSTAAVQWPCQVDRAELNSKWRDRVAVGEALKNPRLAEGLK